MDDARWHLPDQVSLEWLLERAEGLRRGFAAGDAEARQLVATYDPPLDDVDAIPLARARRVVARAFGFDGWSALRRHLDIVAEHTRWPEPVSPDGPPDPDPADRFLRLACLTYTRYSADDHRRAEALLVAQPELARSSVWTLAACGRTAELSALLADQPDLVRAEGGPHRWVPLLYLCYARLGEVRGDPVAAAQVLLDAGADPDAGFLWQGLTSAFTTLTGAFGGGERAEPPHPDAVPLARLLLAHGADPNDNQALYDRMFTPDDSHLELLLAHGLGQERPSPWRRRLGTAYPSPDEMVGEQLRHAAAHGFAARVRLLLEHGVDPDTVGYHPILGDRTPYELAVRHGHPEAAALLAAAGASPGRVDDVDRLVAAALAVDRRGVAALLAHSPGLADVAVERCSGALQLAVEHGHLDALPVLLDLGFPVDGVDRFGATALHQAALDGRVDAVDWLLEHGADRTARDRRFDATPAGWAEHAGHRALAERLVVGADV